MDISIFNILDILSFAVLPCIICVNTKLYQNIKREEHRENGKVVQSIIKHYSIVQIIAWPLLGLFGLMFYISDVVLDIIPETITLYWIHIFRFFYGCTRDYTSFHSLIIAIIRYTFLIYDTKVEAFGIRRLRKYFILSSVIVPISNSFLYEFTQEVWYYGNEPAWYPLFPMRRGMYNDTTKAITNQSVYEGRMNQTYESPIYHTLKQNLPESITQAMKVTESIMLLIMYSNILEGFLYAHATIYYRR